MIDSLVHAPPNMTHLAIFLIFALGISHTVGSIRKTTYTRHDLDSSKVSECSELNSVTTSTEAVIQCNRRENCLGVTKSLNTYQLCDGLLATYMTPGGTDGHLWVEKGFIPPLTYFDGKFLCQMITFTVFGVLKLFSVILNILI